jgi:hypothetical protein
MMMTMGHECEWGMVWREQQEGVEGKEGTLRGEDQSTPSTHMYIYTHVYIMQPTTHCLKRGEGRRRKWEYSGG